MNAYIIWDVRPTLFETFELLRWYSISWILGIYVGYRIMMKIYKVENLDIQKLDNLVFYVMIGAIIGARLGHIIFYDPVYYLNNPIEILPIKLEPTFQFTGLAGLASHGGIVGALIAFILYCKKYQESFWWLLDRVTVAGAALGGFIRLGNLMNSEIVGIPSDVPWAFIFVRVDQIPRHPAQLYEAISYFIISVILYLIWKSRKQENAHGFLFGLGMVLIFIQRFLIELLKENQSRFEENLILNMGQLLSIPIVIAGIIIMIWSKRKSQSLRQQ